MPSQYKESRSCECGFNTTWMASWSKHKKTCEFLNGSSDKDHLISTLQDDKELLTKQLEAKDRQIAAQAEEIKLLIKRPRTVTHNTTNRYVVEQNVNVFGKESLAHITAEQIQSILSDPENAVARFVKLKHRKEPLNSNVRCPNMNRAIYQVVVGGDGEEKEWENRAKGEVLEQLYDDNSCLLEIEANEEDNTPFLDHQDRVKASLEGSDGGRRYKQQLDKIHSVIVT